MENVESGVSPMAEYERSISLKTIYLTLVRRTEMILLLFLPLFLASYIVTNHVMTKSYASTSNIQNNVAISQAAYTLIQNSMKSSEIFETVETNLAEAGTKHANGTAVTASEVQKSISFSAFASNMVSFTVTFATKDSTIAKKALAEYVNVALEANATTYPNLKVYSPAGEAYKTSKENQYFLVGTVASLVVALVIPFIIEIAGDEVFDAKDVRLFGCEASEIRASGK